MDKLDSMLNMRQISAVTGLAYDTVRRYRSDGILPRPSQMLNGQPLWLARVVLDWDEKVRQQPKGPGGRPRGSTGPRQPREKPTKPRKKKEPPVPKGEFPEWEAWKARRAAEQQQRAELLVKSLGFYWEAV